jgi:hypothetical protein
MFDHEFVIPLLIFSIPIIAIAGGITAGIVRTIGQQRLLELAQRERIAAIERGVDPSKLPSLPLGSEDGGLYGSYADYTRRRSHSLLTGGLVAIAAGAGLMGFGVVMDPHDRWWAVGMIPAAIGVALLISSALIRRADSR